MCCKYSNMTLKTVVWPCVWYSCPWVILLNVGENLFAACIIWQRWWVVTSMIILFFFTLLMCGDPLCFLDYTYTFYSLNFILFDEQTFLILRKSNLLIFSLMVRFCVCVHVCVLIDWVPECMLLFLFYFYFLKGFIFKWSLYPMWGLNQQLWYQEMHASLTEPARHPCVCPFKEIFVYVKVMNIFSYILFQKFIF